MFQAPWVCPVCRPECCVESHTPNRTQSLCISTSACRPYQRLLASKKVLWVSLSKSTRKPQTYLIVPRYTSEVGVRNPSWTPAINDHLCHSSRLGRPLSTPGPESHHACHTRKASMIPRGTGSCAQQQTCSRIIYKERRNSACSRHGSDT